MQEGGGKLGKKKNVSFSHWLRSVASNPTRPMEPEIRSRDPRKGSCFEAPEMHTAAEYDAYLADEPLPQQPQRPQRPQRPGVTSHQ